MIDGKQTEFVWLGSMGESRVLNRAQDEVLTLYDIHAQYDARDRYVFVQPVGMRIMLVIDMHTILYHPDLHREWELRTDYLEFRTFKTLDVAVATMAMRYDDGI